MSRFNHLENKIINAAYDEKQNLIIKQKTRQSLFC